MWRNHGLSIVLVSLFVFSTLGQAVAGWRDHAASERQHGGTPPSFSAYLTSGHFWEATGENWESEFLQMSAFVLLTTFLYQKGSAESKRIGVIEQVDLDARDFSHLPDAPKPVKRGGFALRLYEHSLGLTFAVLFVISVAIHAAGGLSEFNNEQVTHGQQIVSMGEYLRSARFWFESFQNWQSEFLSLACMVIGTIFLRQRGSAESKPVFAAHSETGKT
jgi:hypothetical protein